MGITYRFDDRSYETLGRAGVPWSDAIHILRHHPQIKRHSVGEVHIAGPAKDGTWYALALVEDGRNEFLVVDGRRLSPDESRVLQALLRGERP